MDCSLPGSLSMGFSRQEYWSGLPCPPPGDLPNPGIQPTSPALQADSLPSEPPRKQVEMEACNWCVWRFLDKRLPYVQADCGLDLGCGPGHWGSCLFVRPDMWISFIGGCSVTQLCPTLQPHGLQPTRLSCPWNFAGNNTGVGSHFLLQELVLTQGANRVSCVFSIGIQILYHWAREETRKDKEAVNTVKPGILWKKGWGTTGPCFESFSRNDSNHRKAFHWTAVMALSLTTWNRLLHSLQASLASAHWESGASLAPVLLSWVTSKDWKGTTVKVAVAIFRRLFLCVRIAEAIRTRASIRWSRECEHSESHKLQA